MHHRILDIFYHFPIRAKRLVWHVRKINISRFPFWSLELFLQMLEIVGVGDLYDFSAKIVKQPRKLTAREIALAKPIFGESLPYDKIRLDNRAHLGPRQQQFCYVSFYTINSWGEMSDAIFMHELVHIWQYHYLGVVYIPRALAAQQSKEGYNYGGAITLQQAIADGKTLLDFNFEQQASIIEDYFRLKNGLRPQWHTLQTSDLPVYEHFVKQLQTAFAQQ